MDVILLSDVEKLGNKGDVASVADGYARNYLLPRGLAETATPARIEAARKAMEEREEKERRAAMKAEDNRALLEKTVLTITAPVGEGEKLFGSVTSQDIASAIYEARGLRVDKKKIGLPEPLKTLGSHMVEVSVHPSVDPAEVKVIVAPEEDKG